MNKKGSLSLGIIGTVIFVFCIFLSAILPDFLGSKISTSSMELGQMFVLFLGIIAMLLGWIEK